MCLAVLSTEGSPLAEQQPLQTQIAPGLRVDKEDVTLGKRQDEGRASGPHRAGKPDHACSQHQELLSALARMEVDVFPVEAVEKARKMRGDMVGGAREPRP